jgi:hypothetical protein
MGAKENILIQSKTNVCPVILCGLLQACKKKLLVC